MGPNDLTGQKMRNTGSGIGQPEQRPAATNSPTIDDPSQRKAASRIFQSDDDLLHMSRSFGLKVK